MKIALRIAAVLILLHTLGHTVGALTWKNAPNVRVAAVVTGMENEHFDFMGRSLTLASFFNGYGYSMIGVFLLISILLWLLSSAPVRSMILLLGLFLVILAIIEFIYFFPFAAAFSLLAGISTLFAYQKSKAL
ncbi:MAG: hypothetical protein JWR38_1807 [Mucilaginibacter sp.]|nr:hypothetical protein [Mucilaginibacter sp.]